MKANPTRLQLLGHPGRGGRAPGRAAHNPSLTEEDDFISWYCSEPRLAFGRTVVLRYRYELESRQLAPATINLRLAAVRRLAYEASDNGLLSPDLAASIRRVKGAKRLEIRLGNWLTPAQGRQLMDAPDRTSVKGKRNYAMLAVLLGCGLRRSELIR